MSQATDSQTDRPTDHPDREATSGPRLDLSAAGGAKLFAEEVGKLFIASIDKGLDAETATLVKATIEQKIQEMHGVFFELANLVLTANHAAEVVKNSPGGR